jgi:hypothetical protein
MEGATTRPLLQACDQRLVMGDDPHLGLLRDGADEPCEWSDQIGMEAVLRFIEHQQ